MLSRRELIVLAVGLAIMAGGILSLLLDQAVGDGEERKVGRVTFRYRVAQRRASDRVVWQDVRPGSLVYDNNFVRTDRLSEAIVELENGTRVELDPDSMIVIQLDRGRPALELRRGSIAVDNTGGRGAAVKAGGHRLRLDGGHARITATESGAVVETRRGRVVQEEAGRERELDAGGAHLLAQGKPAQRSALLLGQALPEDSHRIFTANITARVEFSWDANLPELEIALDRDFTLGARRWTTQGRRLGVELPDGVYYWRVRGGQQTSERRKFRVVRLPPLVLVAPENAARLMAAGTELPLHFSWQEFSLASGYRVQLSATPEFRNPIERSLRATGTTLPVRVGSWYWRVVAEPSLPGSGTTSEVRRLVLEQKATVRAPRLLEPRSRARLAVGASTVFTWSSDEREAISELQIATDPQFGNVVLRAQTGAGFLRHGNALPAGRFYWRVVDRYAGRPEALTSDVAMFEISEAQPRIASAKETAPTESGVPKSALPKSTGPVAPGVPRIVSPANGSTIDMSARDHLPLRWTAATGAARYRVRLLRSGRVVFQSETAAVALRVTDLSLLDTGDFEVQVEARGAGKGPSTVARSRFRITLSETLDKPEFDLKR